MTSPLPTPAAQIHQGTATGTWNLDPAASRVATATKHFWGLITVRGTFSEMSGRVTLADDGTISGVLDVDASSIDTKHKKRDEHLRSADFFNADQHPKITFATTDVTLTDDTTARVSGTVTAGGAHQDVTFDAALGTEGERATVGCSVEIDHRALGMTWSPLGIAKPTTQLDLQLSFTRP